MKAGISERSQDRALSEVVGFILLLGVLVAAFSLWMMYIVPIDGREAEITHMNEVKDRFTDYKISLDSLWINSPPGDSTFGTAYTRNGVTVSTSMNLGTGGGNTQAGGLFLPLLNPIASPATLSVKDTGDIMTITTGGPAAPPPLRPYYNMTLLQYQSQNNYWIQQTYYYQSGGIFLSQENGSVCRVSPPVSVSSTGNAGSIIIVPIRLYGVGSMGGNGPVRVDTRLKNMPTPVHVQNAWVNISVTVSDYNKAKVWLDTLNTSRRNGEMPQYWAAYGISPYTTGRVTSFMLIKGPVDDTTTTDVSLYLQEAEYDVTLNSIASEIT